MSAPPPSPPDPSAADVPSHGRGRWRRLSAPLVGAVAAIAVVTGAALTVDLILRGLIPPAVMAGAASTAGAVGLGLAWLGRRRGGPEDDPAEAVADRLAAWEGRLASRQVRLDRRLTTYFEFLEYPLPTAENDPPGRDGTDEPIVTPPTVATAADGPADRAATLGEQDRRVREITRDAAEDLFEAIKNGRYAPTGKFDPRLLRDEMLELFERIARVYLGPDVERPLTTVSTAQLLGALSRITLQTRILLDEMTQYSPLALKDYSVGGLYKFYATSVKTLGYYQSVEPYLPFLRYAWYGGRIAMGMNPITGIGWFAAGKLTSMAMTRIGKHFGEMMAVASLDRAVGIVAAEAAGLFGGDYRHRGEGWIVGVELDRVACPAAGDARDPLGGAQGGRHARTGQRLRSNLALPRVGGPASPAGPRRLRPVRLSHHRSAAGHRGPAGAVSPPTTSTPSPSTPGGSGSPGVERRLGVGLRLNPSRRSGRSEPAVSDEARRAGGRRVGGVPRHRQVRPGIAAGGAAGRDGVLAGTARRAGRDDPRRPRRRRGGRGRPDTGDGRIERIEPGVAAGGGRRPAARTGFGCGRDAGDRPGRVGDRAALSARPRAAGDAAGRCAPGSSDGRWSGNWLAVGRRR